MLLRWAKNKVKNWVEKNVTKRDVVLYLVPMILRVLKALARSTKNQVDDAAVEALEAFWRSYLERE